MKILIVDDQEENIYMLNMLLEGVGHEVKALMNGQEAWQYLQIHSVDLIISDILMPVMDGYQFCRKVKTTEKLQEIPFIIYTATYTGPKDEEFARKIGADSFVQKPCEPDLFLLEVEKVMKERTRADFKLYPEPVREEEALKLYNQRLIDKLEHKMVQAEEELVTRRRVEESLRQSERRLIEAQRVARMGDFIWNVETGKITCSQALTELLCLESNEPLDFVTASRQMVHSDDLDEITDWLNNALSSNKEVLPPKEYRMVKGDGKVFYVRTSGKINTNLNNEREIFGTLQDITVQKEAEEKQESLQAQLIQAQKMESIGRLAGGVAHDYNNMLGVILGFTELAKAKTSDDSLQKYLDRILDAVHRSIDITRQLMAFARKQAISPKAVNLNQLIDGVLKMLRKLIGEDVNLNWKPKSNLWTVHMDPSQIDQILINLCVNARDAISGVGVITIETDMVTLSENDSIDDALFEPGDYVKLSVSDNGSGMDEITLDNLFEPFYTTKEVGQGTGLGLCTVYGIIKQNKGIIEVRTKMGNGSRFDIYLPRFRGEDAKVETIVKRPIPKGKGETILIVEDEMAILDLSHIMLQRLNYNVLTASKVADAIRVAREHRDKIDLLIVDLVMPMMNGRDLTAKIREFHPESKQLFISGYTADVTSHQGVLEAEMDFLPKPFSMKEIGEKIAKILYHGRT